MNCMITGHTKIIATYRCLGYQNAAEWEFCLENTVDLVISARIYFLRISRGGLANFPTKTKSRIEESHEN